MSDKKTVLSLFSGCGGMDLGFEGGFWCFKKCINEIKNKDWIDYETDNKYFLKKTGFETIFANDIRKDAKDAWENFFKKDRQIYVLNSIVDLIEKEKNGENIFPKNIDIIIGGFPCQDFSLAGKRLGFKSQKNHWGNTSIDVEENNRGNLYLSMKEVINIVKPKMFIAENVKGITTLKDAQKIIETDFSSADNHGYLVLPSKVLHAADFGVPQSRERIFFIGFKKSALTKDAIKAFQNIEQYPEYNPYPQPTHNYNNKNDINLKEFVKCKDVFYDLKEPNESADINQQNYSKCKMNKGQGNSEINLDYISPTIRSEHHGNIEFRRLSLKNGGKHYDELNKGLIERRLTIRECARLQTFPDNYEFILNKNDKKISASNAYKIIGNAVPCLLAYNIAQTIKEKWIKYFK